MRVVDLEQLFRAVEQLKVLENSLPMNLIEIREDFLINRYEGVLLNIEISDLNKVDQSLREEITNLKRRVLTNKLNQIPIL